MFEAVKLRPCPFCGMEAKIIERETAPDEPGFFCAISCFCGGYLTRAQQYASAATSEIARSVATSAWNTRAADQRCAELEAENARLREASTALRDDLLMRAEIDHRDGTKIVDASNGVWIRFNKALENRDD